MFVLPADSMRRALHLGLRRVQHPRIDSRCRARLVHAAAKSGFAGSAASAYERARPEYSEASVEWLLEGLLPTPLSDADALSAHHGTGSSSSSLSTSARHDVLDIGSGTGKLSRALLKSRPGLRVVGVDPSADMCMQYVEALSGDGHSSTNVLQGTAENIPLLDSSVASVVAGQSFHWFAGADALEEISRVLMPGGTLGLIWNTRDTSVPWVQAIEDIIEPFYKSEMGRDHSGLVPRQQNGDWKKIFGAARGQSEDSGGMPGDTSEASLFEPLESKFLNKVDPMTESELVDLVLSLSVIAAQDSHTRNDVAARVRSILSNDPSVEREGDGEGGGVILLPYVTELYVTSNLKEEDSASSMEAALSSRVDKIATSALHLDDFFGKEDDGEEDDDEDDEDFVDYTDDLTGEWNGPTRGGRRPEPTRHGDWHVMGRCTDF